MKKLLTSRFDISGNNFFRAFRIGMLNKVIPIGNLKQGPGLKPGLVLLLMHYFGKPLFWISVRNERYLTSLYLRLRRKK